MPKTVRIEILEYAISEARSYSDSILANPHIQPGGNYTGLEKGDRFFVGYLGEWAFREWLMDIHIHTFNWGRRTDGKADEHDFKVGSTTIDIKTSDHPNARYLMMPEVQLERTNSDTLVGCTLHLDVDDMHAILWGSILTSQFRAIARHTQRKIATRETLLEGLPASMDELKRYLQVPKLHSV